ncbi:conserved hypothetical protein [Candidatus Zixiibacteriota bacterium]|nr:conserved hypothetical protein [candidate division Zixibacteria bacterium]
MKSWERALRKFLDEWEGRPEVIGALVTGSFAAGTATKYSDIDIHIVLSDKVTWRERGNRVVDGYLIEYFANPVRQIMKYFENDFRIGRHTDARMFVIGKIIFDKTGAVARLRECARRDLKRPFAKPAKTWVETAKYELWDGLDNLKELGHSRSRNFSLMYNWQMMRTVALYARFLRIEMPPAARLLKYFSDRKFREKYEMTIFPDRKFISLAKRCLESPAFPGIEKLTGHVLQKMGGFEINGWKLKTPLDI